MIHSVVKPKMRMGHGGGNMKKNTFIYLAS